MILGRAGLGNHWASQTATQPRLVIRATSSLRGNPRNESNREYNTGSREIVSYNNGDALVSLSSGGFEIIRRIPCQPPESLIDREQNPSRVMPRPPPLPPPYPTPCRPAQPTKYSHSREWDRSHARNRTYAFPKRISSPRRPIAEFPTCRRKLEKHPPLSRRSRFCLRRAFCIKDRIINPRIPFRQLKL